MDILPIPATPLAELKVANAGFVRVEERGWYQSCLPQFAGYACHVAAETPADEVFIEDVLFNELSIKTLKIIVIILRKRTL